MAMKIGAGLALDGESDFRRAVTGVNTDLRVLQSEMKKVTSEFATNKGSTEALAAKNEVLGKQLTTQKDKIEAVKKALENSKAQYGENDDKTKKWQITLNKAETDLNKMENELKDSTKETQNLSTGLDKSSESATDAGNKFDKLGGVLKGVGAAMGTAAIAAGAIALKLGKEVVQSFGELEQNLGGSEAVFGEYAASIQKTGEDAYRNLGVSQSNYLATANKMGALFQGSGIEQQKSLELTEEAMQRAADMASVMGIDMQVALDSVAGAAKGNFTMMDNLGVAMNATTIEAYAASKGFDFVYASASNSEKAQMAMQMFFENTSQYAGNFEKESTQTVTGSLGLLQAAFGSFTAGLGNANADMTNLTGNLVDAFRSVVENITPIVENIITALPDAIDAILAAVGDMLPMLLETVTTLFSQVLNTLLTLLPELIPAAVDAVLTIVNTLVENLPLIIDAAMTIILALATGLAESLPELIPTLVETVMMIVETLIDNIDLLVDAAIAIMMGLAEGMIEALPIVIDKLPVIIDKLITAIMNNLPKLIEMIITLNIEMAKAMIKAVPQLLAKIPQIIVSLVKGFGGLGVKMWDVGKGLVTGIWEGIKNATSWLINKVKGFADDVIGGIKGFFGIHSPSSVMKDMVGKNLALGIGEGFTSEMQSVTSKMNASMPKSFNSSYSISGNSESGYGSSSGGSGYFTSNLIMDSVVVASATGKAQFRRNQSFSRSLGVVPV